MPIICVMTVRAQRYTIFAERETIEFFVFGIQQIGLVIMDLRDMTASTFDGLTGCRNSVGVISSLHVQRA
jgi:hypothetical protein